MKIPYGYLYKRKGGRRFSARSRSVGMFYFSNPGPDGRERPVSLRTTNQEEAERRAVELCGRVARSDRDTWLESLVKLGEWARDELSAGRVERVALSNVWKVYVASRRRPQSGERTLGHYESIWNQFREWIEDGQSQDLPILDDLSVRLCEAYIAHREMDLAAASLKKHIAVLHLVFRIVCPERANPWTGLHTVKRSEPKKKRALEAAEVGRLIASSLAFEWVDGRFKEQKVLKGPACLGREFAGLHLVAYWTGLRLYDAVHLCGEMVDRSNWVISVVPKKTASRKPDPLCIPVSAELQEWMEEFAPVRGPLFPALVKLYGERANSVTECLKLIWTDAEVLDDERGSASFHSLRVTFQSLNDAAGTSRVHTRSVTGHSGAGMSDTYSRQDSEAVRASVERALPEVWAT